MSAASGIIASSAARRSTCPYCGVGCGIVGEVEDGRLSAVQGDPTHPANLGRLCVKGSALHETLGLEGRLLHPQVHGRRASWDEALELVARRFAETVREHGPDSVAFYLSGQLLTEDYYVANKLMKGFIGSANVDTNSRLCMASATAAHVRAFGEDIVPACYEDLELADLILLTGSNAAYAHPVVYQRIARARELNPAKRIVVLDPRRTATCDIADLHLALRPGSDAIFFNGLLVYLADQQGLDKGFLARHCQGFEETLAVAREQAGSLEAVAAACDVPLVELETCYAWFRDTPRAVTLFSQGINQSSSGVDKGNAIINCHLASGKIGKPGAAPFSITGQPNAMGGREVGGLANQLAAHILFDRPELIDLVSAFWNAPDIARKPGLKAVDLFEAIGRGEVKAVWIMATNPVVSLPDADHVRAALEACDFVVVSDCYAHSDTLALADVCLPASGWPEKTGTVTNSERRISLQKALLPPAGEAWPDWKIICEVARRLGFGEAFDFQHPADIFREHAALSGFGNAGERAFDISALAQVSQADYEALEPVQWPLNREWPEGRARFFEDGRFFTPDGRARLLPVQPRPEREAGAGEWLLNTGRLRDQWHTMTRSARAPRLMSHSPEPSLSVHPADAAALGLRDRELAEISNAQGSMYARVALSNGQRRGELFAPIHWSAQFSAQARVGALVAPLRDPLSGQPAFKQTPVQVRPLELSWSAVLLCRRDWQPPTRYWTRVPLAGGTRWYLADSGELPDRAFLERQFADVDDWIELRDSGGQHCRLAGFRDERLEVLLLGTRGGAPQPDTAWQEGLLGQPAGAADRFLLLGGGGPGQDNGPIVCACFQVGRRRIEQAVREGCGSAEALGKALQCGTNCGSCLPELRALVQACLAETPAGS